MSDFERLTTRTTGPNTVAVTMGNPTAATNTARIASTPSQMLAGTSGWLNHHTWGSGTTANGIRVGQAGSVTIAGTKVPVTVSTPISKAALGDGIGILFRNAGKLAGPLGAVMLLKDFADMLDQAGIKQNPDAANDPERPFLHQTERLICEWSPAENAGLQEFVNAGISPGPPGNGCQATGETREKDGMCQLVRKQNCAQWDGTTRESISVYANKAPSGVAYDETPANWDVVRPKFDAMNPLPSDVSQKIIDAARAQEGKNGIEPFKLTTGASTVAAPSSLPNVVKTDTKTSGNTQTTTTTTTSTGITTTGDSVKVSPTTTTTTTTKTTNPDGSVTENTTTETTTTETDEDPTTKPEETPGLCDVYPDILACAKPDLDVPEDEIPRTEKTVTYQAENVFGEGSCPTDVVVQQSAGRSLTFSYAPICGPIQTYVRPAIVALALFGAYLIILPGGWRQS